MSLPAQKSSLTPALWTDKRSGDLSPMDVLFNRFDGMYPNRWRAAFANEQSVANWRDAWALAFADEGLTMDDVAVAVKRCRAQFDWPPSLPEFLKLCAVTVEPESAFYEAVAQMRNRAAGVSDAWSHPAIYWAAVQFGTWDLRSVAYERCKPRWGRILSAKLAQRCEPVPAPMMALPAPGETTPDPDGIARLLAHARASITRDISAVPRSVRVGAHRDRNCRPAMLDTPSAIPS